MYFRQFYSEFPKIAERETRALTILQTTDGLPAGEYGFIDFFCADKKCDCRRVMVKVMVNDSSLKDPYLAVISFGWEPKAFYRKWSKSLSDEDLNWFRGPALDPYQPQTKYAPMLLEYFKEMLNDKPYRQRIIRHYAQFKQKTGAKLPKDLEGWTGSMQDCGCESGLKFRFCCGAKK
jgi:hypothetical protein